MSSLMKSNASDIIKQIIDGKIDHYVFESVKNGCVIDYHVTMEDGQLLVSTDQLPDEDDEYDVYFSVHFLDKVIEYIYG